jgi:hypothetical protein
MTFLGTPMVANTVWTVTPFRALRVCIYSSSVVDFLETVSAAITAVMATAENFGAWLRATEGWGSDVLETANLDFMATLGNDFFDLEVALNYFQVGHLMAIDNLLDMTTRKLHIVNLRHAKATVFST